MHLDWQSLGFALLNTVLTFGGGAIGLSVAGWIADTLCRLIPVLHPFRNMVQQWILAQLEALKDRRAQGVVVGAEQSMNAQLKKLDDPTPEQVDRLKAQRNADAIAQAINRRIAGDGPEARDVIERAVGALKTEGKL